MIILVPVSANQRLKYLAKRKLAVAVTAPILKLPSSFCEAAGAQWKLMFVSLVKSTGGVSTYRV
jgi:hypothetical protein